jgi:AcrR family transcriptional regulator
MAREFIRSMPSTELHAAHPELLHLVAEVIATAVASGELPDRVPADLAASLVLLQMVAPMTYMISGQQADIDELSRLLLDQWLAGMAHAGIQPQRTNRRRASHARLPGDR